MDAEASASERSWAYVVPRARVVGGAGVVGAIAGLGLVLALVALGDWRVVRAARVGFVLGALAFGGGLTGWAGSAMAGRGFEAMQEHLDANTNWTERKSRRAMARILGFGAGAMLATGVVEVVALGA